MTQRDESAKDATLERELNTLNAIIVSLSGFDVATRLRMMRFILDKFGVMVQGVNAK